MKIPGTKRIVQESINAVHHTPRGKAIWINFDPPPTKNFDIWIKGDCQNLPALYDQFEESVVREKEEKELAVRRKGEERLRADEERHEKRVRAQLQKEENQRIRDRRKQEKQDAKLERETQRQRQRDLKAQEKARRQAHGLKRRRLSEGRRTELLTPISYTTDSSLSSPSLSDEEFAGMVNSGFKDSMPQTPTIRRIMDYLPTPATTPRKSRQYVSAQQESPLKDKGKHPEQQLRTYSSGEDQQKAPRNSMSIQFLTDTQ
jgi:hypothetical protein